MAFALEAIETSIFRAGGELADFVITHVPTASVQERVIIAVTSKIVSLAEKRVVPKGTVAKADLVRAESDRFLGEIGHGCFLTVKHGLLIPSAGIDESNSDGGGYILYPADPFASARRLWKDLRTAWGLESLGVVLTDSRTSPLRRGVTGVALAHWGFRGIRNLVGSKDLFGRELRMTRMNLADGIAGAAVMLMGEGAERRPLAVAHGAEVEFTPEVDPDELRLPLSEDLYFPLLKSLL